MDTPLELVSEVESDLLCPICLHLFRDPVEINECEHIFCRVCIEGALQGGACPVCQEQITDKSIRRAHRFVINRVDAVMVNCPNKCGSHIPFGRLQKHANEECEDRTIPCPDGCEAHIKAADLLKHRETCGNRKEICEIGDGGCGIVLVAKEMDGHHCLVAIRQTLAEMTEARQQTEQDLRDMLARTADNHEGRCRVLEQSVQSLLQQSQTHQQKIEQHVGQLDEESRRLKAIISRMDDRIGVLERKMDAPKTAPRVFGEENRSMIDTAWVLAHIDAPQTIIQEAIRDIFANAAHPENWNFIIAAHPEVAAFRTDRDRPGIENRNEILFQIAVNSCNYTFGTAAYRAHTFDGKTWVEHNAQQVLQLLTDLVKSISASIDSLAKHALDVSLVDKYKALRSALVSPETQTDNVPSELFTSILAILARWSHTRLLLRESLNLQASTPAPLSQPQPQLSFNFPTFSFGSQTPSTSFVKKGSSSNASRR
eukprot:GILJ01002636.1.p1 GENE.GILJ01002636.1~~GILJ01002636.1.p1  ORF type:complete len:484 (+),score=37.74 GILJ01002636.1:49-1500(+)